MEEASSAGEKALQYAASGLLHAGRHDQARSYVDRLLRLNSTSAPGLVISGWIELAAGNVKAAFKNFKTALVQVSYKKRSLLFFLWEPGVVWALISHHDCNIPFCWLKSQNWTRFHMVLSTFFLHKVKNHFVKFSGTSWTSIIHCHPYFDFSLTISHKYPKLVI